MFNLGYEFEPRHFVRHGGLGRSPLAHQDRMMKTILASFQPRGGSCGERRADQAEEIVLGDGCPTT